MALIETSGLIKYKDEAGNMYMMMPVTTKDNVDGLDGVHVRIIGTTTAGDGSAYTATVEGIDALEAGATFVMIPHVVSTTTAPTLNVNGLGAKNIRRRVSGNSTSLTTAGGAASWLTAGKPILMTYDGTFWIADFVKPAADDLYGTVPISAGGTGATTVEDALANLGLSDIGGLSIEQAWAQGSLPMNARWKLIAFGNGRFVAIAYSPIDSVSSTTNIAAYSDDGINWTSVTLPVSGHWTAIAFGNNTFVAIASQGTVVYSEDGVTWSWTTALSGFNGDGWAGITYSTYSSGRFVAVASGGTSAAYSNDGINWTKVTLPVSGNWTAIAANSIVIITMDYGGNTALYNTMGGFGTWTKVTLPLSSNWNSIAFGNSTFVAVSYGSSAVVYSTDNGKTWTQGGNAHVSANWTGIVYDAINAQFISIGESSEVSYSNDRGKNWTNTYMVMPDISAKWSGCVCGSGDMLVAISYNTSYTSKSKVSAARKKCFINNNTIVDDEVFAILKPHIQKLIASSSS